MGKKVPRHNLNPQFYDHLVLQPLKAISYFFRDTKFIHFRLLDADHTSKYLALAFSTMVIVITSPMAAALVQFETNCHNRTLINRLIGVEFFFVIVWNMTVQMLAQVRYLAGPFPDLVCKLEYLIKNMITLWWILLVNFVLIVRYIFVFKSKNPTAVQDEFWIVFLVIWSIGFGLICQCTYLIFPGKQPMSFYFCLGKMHKSLIDVKVKNNASFNFLVIMTIICHTFIHIKFFVHKQHETLGSVPHPLPQSQLPSSPNCGQPRIQTILMNRIKQESLFSLASNAISIMVMVLSGIAPNVLNRIHPSMVDEYPNYLWAYLHQHFTVNVGILCVNFLYYYKKPAIAKQIKDWLQAIYERIRTIFS